MRYLLALLTCASIGGAQDAAKPHFTGTLCQGWDQRLTPEGPTNTFVTDNASVRLVYRADTPIAAGHRLTAAVFEGDRMVLRGDPYTTPGKSNLFGTGFLVAGNPRLQNGGSFRFRVYWDDDPQPVIDLPFTVTVAKRWALLVGISDYPPAGHHPGDCDLPACDKDAQRMRDLLVNSFGFQKERIAMVLNLEATSARIDKELTELARRAGPDDAVLFYYCGHGTQIPDLDGDEADGWDEALDTADVRPKLMTTEDHLETVLSDDRIAELLAQFKTKNVTVIFDSCHSGTAVRAGEKDTIDADGFFVGMKQNLGFDRKLMEKAEDVERKNPKGVAQGLDIDQRYVFLSAAQAWETGMTSGRGCFFSAALREAMRTSNGQSWGELMTRIRPAVQRFNSGQAPQVTGAVRRYPFSLAEAPADAPYERPTVAVAGGWSPKEPNAVKLGATKGEIALVSGMASLYDENGGVAYDVYPDGSRFTGTPKGRVVLTGQLQVIQRPGASPLAYASAQIFSGSVQKGDRLVPRSVVVPGARPSVGITFMRGTAQAAKQKMQAVVQAVIALLRKDPAVNMVTRGDVRTVDYIIVPAMKDGQFIASIYTPRSQFIGNCRGSASDVAANVREFVTKRHQQFTRVNRLSNTSPSLRLRVVLEGGVTLRRAGATVKFKGYVDRPAYLYAFVASEGGVTELVASSKSPLQPNLPFSFAMSMNPGFKGRAVTKVLATEKPLDLMKFNQTNAAHRADALFEALRKAFPAQAVGHVIATDGWADEAVWVEFR